jgi:hypothetical protein
MTEQQQRQRQRQQQQSVPEDAPGAAGGDPFDDWDLGSGPGAAAPPRLGALPDPTVLLALLAALRRALPRELQEQLDALMREVLLTLRALIDWQLERLERRSRPPAVEDIPLD